MYDLATIINASHIFNQNLQSSIKRHLYLHGVGLGIPIQHSYLFTIHINNGIVTQPRNFKCSANRLIEMTSIQYISIPLIQLFKSQGSIRRHGFLFFCKSKHIRNFIQLNRRYFDNRIRSRSFRNCIFNIFLDHIANRIILWSYPACLANRSIIIITGHIRLNITLLIIISTTRKTKIRTSMHHIEVERDIILQILLGLTSNSGSSYLRERLCPMRQPTRIKFCNHIRTFSVVILINHFFQILNITFAICRRQSSRSSPTLKKPTAIRSKQRYIKSCISQLLLDFSIISAMFFQRYILTLGNV